MFTEEVIYYGINDNLQFIRSFTIRVENDALLSRQLIYASSFHKNQAAYKTVRAAKKYCECKLVWELEQLARSEIIKFSTTPIKSAKSAQGTKTELRKVADDFYVKDLCNSLANSFKDVKKRQSSGAFAKYVAFLSNYLADDFAIN